jgi:hypothetical protein
LTDAATQVRDERFASCSAGGDLSSAARTVPRNAPLAQAHARGHVAVHVGERGRGQDTVLDEEILEV